MRMGAMTRCGNARLWRRIALTLRCAGQAVRQLERLPGRVIELITRSARFMNYGSLLDLLMYGSVRQRAVVPDRVRRAGIDLVATHGARS